MATARARVSAGNEKSQKYRRSLRRAMKCPSARSRVALGRVSVSSDRKRRMRIRV